MSPKVKLIPIFRFMYNVSNNTFIEYLKDIPVCPIIKGLKGLYPK